MMNRFLSLEVKTRTDIMQFEHMLCRYVLYMLIYFGPGRFNHLARNSPYFGSSQKTHVEKEI